MSVASPLFADISKYQGHPNFKLLKNAIDMLIIRVQYGSSYEDPYHKYDEAHAENYGIPYGEYAYGHFVSVKDAIVEAKDFLKRKDKDARFLVLDVENNTVKSCGTTHLREASQAFIDTCRDAGYKTGFYVSHNLYMEYGLNKVKSDFLWIPRYGANNGKPSTKPSYPCDLWQFTEKGKVSGISGYVDLSTINGNKNLNWFLGVQPKPKKEASKPVEKNSDIKGHWAEKVINEWIDRKIFAGSSDGLFHPDQQLTRAEMCVLLTRLLEKGYLKDPTK